MLNFPQKGRGLGHVVTPKIFGIRSNISSKLLELGTSNLEKPIGRANNFPRKGRVLGHVTPKIFDIQWNIIFKTTRARDFKFGIPPRLGKAECPCECESS